MKKEKIKIEGYKGNWEVFSFTTINNKKYYLLWSKKYEFFLVTDDKYFVLTQTRMDLECSLAILGIKKDYYDYIDKNLNYYKMKFE